MSAPSSASAEPSFDLAAWLTLTPAQRAVCMVLALGAVPRTRTWLTTQLNNQTKAQPLGQGGRLTPEAVREALNTLVELRWVEAYQGVFSAGEAWGLHSAAVAVVYPAVLEQAPVARWRTWLAEADGYAAVHHSGWPLNDLAAVARLRLEALAGSDAAYLAREVLERLEHHTSAERVMSVGLLQIMDLDVLPMLHVSVQAQVLDLLLIGEIGGQPAPFELAPVMREYLEAETDEDSWPLRLQWALLLMLRAELAEVPRVLAPMPVLVEPPVGAHQAYRVSVAVVQAMLEALSGRWAEAEAGFEAALRLHRALHGTRAKHGLGGVWGSVLYLMTLLRLGGAERQARALKFALNEKGKREPVVESPEGLFAHAIQVRQGDRVLEPDVYRFQSMKLPQWLTILDLFRWLTRAWLKTGTQPSSFGKQELEAYDALHEHFSQAGLRTPLGWLEAARAVLESRPAPANFFIDGPPVGWQNTLNALLAVLNPEGGKTKPGSKTDEAAQRLLWVLHLEKDGGVVDVAPYEQKRGLRGWSKAKEVPLSRFQRSPGGLSPADAKVVATLRQDSNTRAFRLDWSEALPALVGHPHLAVHPDTDQLVELQEAQPELDVTRLPGKAGAPDQLRVRMQPHIDPAGTRYTSAVWIQNPAHQREVEALKSMRVFMDGPQRAKLYRLTPAQRRVALLLGPKGLELPADGLAQLEPVLAGLGAHFPIHSDAAPVQASRELPADPRLRAELQPEGEGLLLRLVAAPFGPEHLAAPRPIPGQGRARLVAALGGETLGVQRNLPAEAEHLERVLDACPMLTPLPEASPCEWLLESPDEALALLERLPTLNALQGLDWPKGKPVRVDSASLGQLKLSLHTGREWFEMTGELAVDEQLVLGLQQLMQLAGPRRSRFVPLGEGRYLALTQELRERLDDLAAVAEAGKTDEGVAALRVPPVAAPWLAQATEGAQLTADTAFTERLQRLEAARTQVPALPATLQASLRPYQEEGFEWAMRLSHAGLGACLADDMGLGKTLQALAVLLARAHLGPALVVAPTSLLGNWRAEARKFAPSLRVSLHADSGSERTAQLESLGAGQVLLVSYPMVQIDQEAFAAKRWATLVLDEAQAIKNAAAKRSQAVFELQADFRLALSGTPVENRLAELWSIMRACNPGLLGPLTRFNERFAGPIERQRDRSAQRLLRRLIAPFILRRTKSQVLDDLPPRTELIHKVEPDALEQAHYEALRREVLASTEASLLTASAGEAHFNVLAGLTKLRRAACDPRLVNPQFSAVGAKVQAFGELAAELVANGHKALVFSQFVDFLGLLKAPLEAAGIRYQYLDGSTPSAERTRRVDAFQAGEGDLFLISLKAGGFGLNLTVADYVVIADPWWNPAAEDQATGRAHRMGQQRPVTVYRLVNEGTLEHKIIALHQQKRELADLLLEGQENTVVPDAQALLALMRGDALAEEDGTEGLPSV